MLDLTQSDAGVVDIAGENHKAWLMLIWLSSPFKGTQRGLMGGEEGEAWVSLSRDRAATTWNSRHTFLKPFRMIANNVFGMISNPTVCQIQFWGILNTRTQTLLPLPPLVPHPSHPLLRREGEGKGGGWVGGRES